MDYECDNEKRRWKPLDDMAVAGALFGLIKEGVDIKKLIAITVTIFVLMMSLPSCIEKPPVPASQPELPTTPSPAPGPAPEPDESEYSEEEICSLIWDRLPSQLPDGYKKSHLDKDTRKVTYGGNRKWLFTASGTIREEEPITTEVVRKDYYWVEREICESTSYDLQLKAIYFERTKTLEIESIKKLNEKISTDTFDTPILRNEIKLNWMTVVGHPQHYYLEGCIENIGKIPISGLFIEFFFFDEDENILETEKYKITPDPVPSGEIGKFMYDFIITGKHIYSYDYRFILETGEVFKYLEGSGEEEPIFFCEMNIAKFTRDMKIPSGLFSTYVTPLDKQVRDNTLSVISDVPEGVFSDADSWKIWKIHNWVANNIVYVSDPLGFEYMAYPHETLDSKAGDCDDYAVLLASMYESSGLDAMIAFVDTTGDKKLDHVTCLVYYPQKPASFLEEEEIIIDKLDISYPLGERYFKYIPSTANLIPYKTSDIYGNYEEGIWIVADPLFEKETGIVGYITYEPYVILAVDDVGS